MFQKEVGHLTFAQLVIFLKAQTEFVKKPFLTEIRFQVFPNEISASPFTARNDNLYVWLTLLQFYRILHKFQVSSLIMIAHPI